MIAANLSGRPVGFLSTLHEMPPGDNGPANQ